MSLHWAWRYIGRPYLAGASGPLAYDCWGLVRAVQREQFGRDLPEIAPESYNARDCAVAVRDAPERARWAAVAAPEEGDCVLMAHHRHPSHVGVWVAADGGGVLHCVAGSGVVFATRSALLLAGWGRLEAYRFAGEAACAQP